MARAADGADMKFRRTAPGKEDAEYDRLVESWGGVLGGRDRFGARGKLVAELERDGPNALAHLFWRAAARFVERTDRDLAKFHLTMERLCVLREVVTAHCPLDMKSLARRLSITPPTLSALVSRLVTDEYVVLSRDCFDRRAKVIDVTREGLLAATGAGAVLASTAQELTKALSSRDRHALLRALAAIEQALPPEDKPEWQPPEELDEY